MARKSVAAVKREAAEKDAQNKSPEQDQVDDSSVLVGGPGQDDQVIDDAGDKVPRESLVTIEIDGTEYKVSKETADIMEAQRRSFDRSLAEVKKTVQAPAREPEKKSDKEAEDDLTVKFFSNPKGFLDDFKKQILSEARTVLTAEYTQDQNQKKFWDDFYKEHKDLDPKKDHVLVEAVLRTNADRLYNMKVEKASGELADLTRKEILNLMNRHKGVKVGNRTTTLEGASTSTSTSRGVKIPDEGGEKEKRPSLSQIIKQRKDARRRAHLA